MTKEQLLRKLAANKAAKTIYNWGSIISTINSASPETKTALVNAINSNNDLVVGDIIMKLVNDDKVATAKNKLDTLAAGNKLTIDEIIEYLE